ncbi:MAG: DegV family protein [Eubacteriales bacterium]|nr:DegV family protein [Eubacteriales bacterium]
MSDFTLTCCSTADLPKDFLDSRQIPYVCFHFTLEGKEYPDDLGQTISFVDFYRRMSEGATPTTSQVNADQFMQLWEPILQEGRDILHITLSSGLSGTYGSACTARGILLEKYPARRIAVVDSLGASSGYGLLVSLAADLRDNGSSLEDTLAWLEKNKLRLHHWFFSTDLTSYYRGGRISKASHMFGTMLNICPLLNMNSEGKLIPRSKYRGKKRVIQEIVRRMEEHAEGGTAYNGKCYISQSACYEDARQIADLVEERFPNLAAPVMINSIGTVIGSHTGPGTVALFFLGDERGE